MNMKFWRAMAPLSCRDAARRRKHPAIKTHKRPRDICLCTYSVRNQENLGRTSAPFAIVLNCIRSGMKSKHGVEKESQFSFVKKKNLSILSKTVAGEKADKKDNHKRELTVPTPHTLPPPENGKEIYPQKNFIE